MTKFLKWLPLFSILAINNLVIAAPPLTKPLPAHSGSVKVSPDWLLKLPSYGYFPKNISWLNNHTVIYSLPVDDENTSMIKAYDLIQKKTLDFGQGINPIPSPDGKWIAYVKGKNAEKQLWLLNVISGSNKQISSVEGGLGAHYKFSYEFIWSQDSRKIILEHQIYTEPHEKVTRAKSTILSFDILTDESQLLISLDAAIRYLAWIPGTENIVFVKERVGALYREEEDKDWLQILNTKDKSIKTLVRFDGLQQFLKPAPSPDGKSVAILYDAENPIFSFMLSIGLVSINNLSEERPALQQLTHELQLGSPTWSPNANELYALRTYGAYSQLYKINAKTGGSRQLTNEPFDINSYSLSPDGKYLAWIGIDAHDNYKVKLSSSNGRSIQTLAFTAAAEKNVALSEVREIEWKTPDYPVKMRGLLVMPLYYKEGEKYPLIVDIHGGDAGASIYLSGGILVSTPLEWQLWAAKGYAVFVPEFRSSASFGSLAITRDLMQEHNCTDGDLKDIETGVDYLIGQGIADAERLAVIGHSAGGLRANWLTVSTHRYKAVVSKEGWADELTIALNMPPSKRIYTLYGGSPSEVPENYLKNSALHHVENADTPTLFLMANPKNGGADNYNTVYKLYQLLKQKDIETKYKYYPDEGHVFEHDENRKDALNRTLKWIDQHFKINNLREKNR